jgi:hypothetical protein
MKLPGDSDKQQAVSHEMMQRSLQSQRRVVQRVGLLEDRVDQIESAEVEPGVDIGDLADGAKKIAKGIGKSIGKNAQLLGDKAGKAAQAAGKAALDATGKGLKSAADATGKGIKDAASATGKGIKKGIGKAGKGLTNVGKGLRDFIKDRAKVAKGIGKKSPVGKGGKGEADTSTGRSNVAPKPEPKQNLVPDPVAAMGVDPKTGEYLSKEERIRQFKERREMRAQGIDPDLPEAGDISKVDKLEDAGIGEDQVKNKVKKDLEDEFDIDPKMKKAFMDALALPAKSAAVAMTDLLEKIPAPSKEASKILNRNISKISNAFKLGAASAEVANDEEDNDNKEEKGGSVIGGLLAKAINFVRGKVGGGGGEEGGEDTGGAIVQSPGGAMVGDPTEGRRAPYTGTADGIGLGDGGKGTRAMQPIKKRKSLARKLFNLTPMGMAFNAGNKLFKGVKNIANSKTFKNLKGIAGKAFGMTPVGMMAKFMMKNNPIMKRIFNKEQTTNLTELTDKTIQENRDSADAKTKKDIALAAGTGDVAAAQKSPPPMQQEGGALAQPSIRKSKYIDLYNTTSQF